MDSSNYKSASIQLDKADYGALINLANKARRVKAYSYFNFTNATAMLMVATKTPLLGLTKVSKAAGVPDPVKMGDIARGYVATTSTCRPVLLLVVLAPAFDRYWWRRWSKAGGFVVAPGGFAQNNATYGNVADYLIAEYGSLSEQQRNVGYVKNAAQAVCA